MKRVEFPAGSGRVAFYSVEEAKAMSAIVAAAEQAGDARVSQVQILHDLKIEFGVSLVHEVELGDPQPGDVVVRL